MYIIIIKYATDNNNYFIKIFKFYIVNEFISSHDDFNSEIRVKR